VEFPINLELPTTKDHVANRNSLNSYLPIRNKGNDFEWNNVVGIVLSVALRKEFKNYAFSAFVADCKQAFEKKLEEPGFWSYLEQMYFANQDIFKVSPLFQLFLAQELNAGDKRVARVFESLLENYQIPALDEDLNFLEREVQSVLNSKLKTKTSSTKTESPYLPYLARSFQRDLKFLASKPKYLLVELQNFLSFYGFVYSAQLALSIRDWRKGEPQPKPLYFILDSEKASQERVHVINHGYRLFHNSGSNLFPMLSMLENLQPNPEYKKPLWYLAEQIYLYPDNAQVCERLSQYAKAFRSQRELNDIVELTESDDSMDLLEQIMSLAIKQFSDKKTTRKEINEKYIKELEHHMGKDFIQSRGRSGKVLAFNQDQMILLTNLCIGEQEKLRFHELVNEFQERGVFVDKQTEQALISFFERIGNVERLSDSGDAVYVRKTI